MAETLIPIRSVKQYFREFAVEGIGKGAKPELVKEQLLDAFQKEIFAQITLKYHDPAILSKDAGEVDDATREGVHNILENSFRKWRRLCELFARYRETRMLIEPEDLSIYVNNTLGNMENAVSEEEAKEVVLTNE